MIYINLLIIFLLLIFIHELGHYTAARLFGVKVTVFSIGFGKSLFTYKDKQNTSNCNNGNSGTSTITTNNNNLIVN